jgi:hypothetical protein
LIAKDDTGAPIVDAYFKKGATHEDALVSLLHRLDGACRSTRCLSQGVASLAAVRFIRSRC